MKTVPSKLGTKARWIEIAKLVDGHDAKSCYTRFKAICAMMSK